MLKKQQFILLYVFIFLILRITKDHLTIFQPLSGGEFTRWRTIPFQCCDMAIFRAK